MNLNLLELQVRNFMSFGNSPVTIDLTNVGSTLILGNNLDNGNTGNAVGKTTIINALCFGLYNKPFQNISLNRLINASNSHKNTLMEVRLTFTKGNDTYSIYRCRGESFNVVLTKNDVDMTFASVADNDSAIIEIIGISYELFTKVIIFSGKSIPFLEMPVAQQRNQIEELFSITLLSEKAVKLKKLIKDTEDKIMVENAVIKERDSQVLAYGKALKEARERIDRWEQQRVDKEDRLLEQLEFLKEVDFAQEKELHHLTQDLHKQIAEINLKLSPLQKDSSSLSAEIKKLNKEIAHLADDKCPYCLQNFAGSADKVVKNTKIIKENAAKLQLLENEISALTATLQELQGSIKAAQELMSFSTLSQVIKAEAEAGHHEEQINILKSSVNPHLEALQSLIDNPINKADTEKLDLCKKELEHQQFLLKLLTDKSSFIRRRIINRTIPFLNSRLVYYTKELGLPHIVRFDDDMSCSVTEMGRELDFGNLSGAESKQVNLSFSLAFRDVLHQLHAKVNCLFIDEIDGSLAAPGVEAAFKLLKQKTRDDNLGLWIISHRPEAIGRFDRHIVIKKFNGFSTIEEIS